MIILAFVLFGGLVLVHIYVGVYAAPIGMAFVFGWVATALDLHWVSVLIAALMGAGSIYLLLGYLRRLGESWPFAHILVMAILFLPSFLFSAGLTYLLMHDEWSRGGIESGIVALFIGTLFGLFAYGNYLNKRGIDPSTLSKRDPE